MKMNGTGVRIGVMVLALGVSLLAIPTSLKAQKAPGISRVGWLEVCGPGPRRPHFDIFRARLAEQGYVEGKNLIIEQRFADCRYDRMPGLAAELVQVPVDVLFTMGTRAARIVAGTVKTTPLVVYSCDPEHVTRLARPGGNLTGVTCMTTELSPKRLELLKEFVPKAPGYDIAGGSGGWLLAALAAWSATASPVAAGHAQRAAKPQLRRRAE
jgi:putative ABC transport system substrate-binding protein